VEQPGPAKWAQYLNVETAEQPVLGIFRSQLAVERPADMTAGRPVLGLDIQYVEKDVPIAERALAGTREPEMVDPNR